MINPAIKRLIYGLNENPISRLYFKRQIKNRAKLALNDIESLAKDIKIFLPFTKEIHKPNDWYGHANNLKKFLGLSKDYQFKFIMEHGLYLSEQVDEIDQETNLPSIITYSTYREKILKGYRKHVFKIGPFINYAESFLSETKIKSERKRLGKSVLFFPAHSTDVINFDYDITQLCKQIKKIAKGYETIRVCLYWKDILKGRAKIYQDFGFETVTAGHMLDPLFLSRLKSLILISDLTISNIISSQAGFCIFLGKPHITVHQKIQTKASGYWKKRIDDAFESDGYLEVFQEFSKLNYKITRKQKELTKKYWGTDNTKTKSQLSRIVKQTEEIYRKENGN